MKTITNIFLFFLVIVSGFTVLVVMGKTNVDILTTIQSLPYSQQIIIQSIFVPFMAIFFILILYYIFKKTW